MSDAPTRIEVLAAYYEAGIGVAAAAYGVQIQTLAIEYDAGAKFGFSIEPLAQWIVRHPESFAHRVELIEEYVTVCLAGDAGRFIHTESRRCQLQRSLQGAGPELRQLRLLWECLEPETERALVVALGTLPKLDDGDPEASVMRLWKRACRLLRQHGQRSELDQLARHLLKVRQMTGTEVVEFLKRTQ